VLEEYIEAVGGHLEVNVVKGDHTIPLIPARRPADDRDKHPVAEHPREMAAAPLASLIISFIS
jgi:hypothetical protein